MEEIINPGVDVTLKGKSYKVHFPNIQQFIDIEIAKQTYSKGNYALLAWGNIESMNRALDFVDAVSYFSVMIGKEFISLYGLQNVSEILTKFNHTQQEGRELLEAYKQYAAFYNSIESRKDRPDEKSQKMPKRTIGSDSKPGDVE